MITIKQLAEFTNVSRGTVDRVLNNRGGVSPETEKKVKAAVKALNYSPNRAGKNLAVRKKNLKFGFILFSPNDYNPFFKDVEVGIEEQAQKLKEFGVTVDIQYTGISNFEKQLELLDYYAKHNYNGIAIAALNTPIIAKKIKKISQMGIPVITANTDIPSSGRLAYVGSNYYQCGKVAANLMELVTGGNANIGIINGSKDIMCITERSAGFEDYLASHNLDMQIISSANNFHYDEIESYLITKNMLDSHPEIDSLYLASAGVSGACKAIIESKRKIKIISHDCAPATKELLKQKVITATIDQQPHYQGSKPLELLFDVATNGADSIEEYYYVDAIIKISSNI